MSTAKMVRMRDTLLFFHKSAERIDDVLNRAHALENFGLEPLAGELFQFDCQVDRVDAVDIEIAVQVRLERDTRLVELKHLVQDVYHPAVNFLLIRRISWNHSRLSQHVDGSRSCSRWRGPRQSGGDSLPSLRIKLSRSVSGLRHRARARRWNRGRALRQKAAHRSRSRQPLRPRAGASRLSIP